MVILTFIRHGETDFNKYGILQGHLNVPLNSKGRQQADHVGRKLDDDICHNVTSSVDLVISSDLDRAYDTAAIIVERLTNKPLKPIVTTPLLRERYLGKLEGVDMRQLVTWEEFPEPKRMLELQNLLSQKSNLVSIIQNSSNSNSPNSTSSISSNNNNINNNNNFNQQEPEQLQQPQQESNQQPKLLNSQISYYNALKHLPQKELKIESKQKLIKRAKDAFQFILSQVPQNYINNAPPELNIHSMPGEASPSPLSSSSSSDDSTSSSLSSSSSSSSSSISNNNENEIPNFRDNYNDSGVGEASKYSSVATKSEKDFHILVVSHSLTLKTILSLLLLKKPPVTPFCNSSTNESITQSEESSHQHFKWISLELKNASLLTASFTLIEKKTKDKKKRAPRDIHFYPLISLDASKPSSPVPVHHNPQTKSPEL